MKTKIILAAIGLLLFPLLASSKVADSSAGGFTVELTFMIRGAPDDVYRRLVHNVGDWWNSEHTFSGDSHNLTLDDKPMGCFCEKLPNQGGVRHMEVVFVAPGKMLRLSGGLGPLQSVAAAGSMTIAVSPAAAGTKLDVTYAVAGYLPKGMDTWAAPVDSVLTEQFTRLKAYVEQGPQGLEPENSPTK